MNGELARVETGPLHDDPIAYTSGWSKITAVPPNHQAAALVGLVRQ